MVRRHKSLNGKDGGGHGKTRQLAQQRTADGVRGSFARRGWPHARSALATLPYRVVQRAVVTRVAARAWE